LRSYIEKDIINKIDRRRETATLRLRDGDIKTERLKTESQRKREKFKVERQRQSGDTAYLIDRMNGKVKDTDRYRETEGRKE
jgi:hypothetical protein